VSDGEGAAVADAKALSSAEGSASTPQAVMSTAEANTAMDSMRRFDMP
jgi:hypothetical protein